MKTRHCLLLVITACFSLVNSVQPALSQSTKSSLTGLHSGDKLHGFKAIAVYLNDADEPMGGRFLHEKTGFTFDMLQIESVPQTFIWVNTFPVSDKGEPHTQEHLLITKGNKGHELNTREGMSLAQSNAFTSQLHTVYHFNTGAGGEVFYNLLDKYLDALLYPDYTNEEVRREVRNWGIAENPDKTLRLEEKGSVYNEMSSTTNNPYSVLYDSIGRLIYGNAHPLSYNAGGLPSLIREMKPEDISKYHADNYYLGNMGAITSLPKNMKLPVVLDRMDKMLTHLNRSSKQATPATKLLPQPQPAQEGMVAVVDYPSENAQEPGSMLMAYPAALKLNATEDLLLANFLSVFAGDATTNLYKIFVDSKTRQAGIDAQSVYAYNDDKQGQPILIGLDGIKAGNLTKEKATLARQLIIDELKKIAAYKDHSPELLAFNKRYENSLTSLSRAFAKFVNSPPKFGFRNTYDAWYTQLEELRKIPGFKKSVILKPQFEDVKKILAGDTNPWKNYLEKWKLTSSLPYVVVTKANPSLLARSDSARKARAATEVERLKQLYKLSDEQQTILRYKAVYDSNTAVLEKLEQAHTIKFIDNPPLTLDDELNYKQQILPGNIPVIASVFDNMTSATIGIAINLDPVPQDKLVYLALLPELLTETGITKNGKAISYEDMTQLIQQQILSLESYYSINESIGRAELVVKGAGNNAVEAQKAIEWMNDVLKQPNWAEENLPRLGDLVEQQLTDIRKKMQGPEEYWVNDPSQAYRVQDKPLLLATGSFLTRAHNIFRLKWMLKSAHDKTDSTLITKFLSSLANAETNRQHLKNLLTKLTADSIASSDSAGVDIPIVDAFNSLPGTAKLIAKDAARDLQQMLNDIPDNSLDKDWKYLCHIIQKDLAQTPEKTLTDLNAVRKSLLKNDNARLFMIGSAATQQKLTTGITQLLSGFDKQPAVKQQYSKAGLINERVKTRMNTTETPVFAGLINPDSQTGVFINSVPLVTYKDTAREKLLAFLAAELYGGGGKQSVFTKTTGAGLSYSTGVGASPSSGRFYYYAERTPELPQTLRFVIDEIKRSPVDTAVVDYVVSLAVGSFRSAADYEKRGESMASDLAYGITPESVKRFRLAILKLRKEPGLVNAIYQYKDAMYEQILPGYGKPSKEVAGGSFFVIGPEKQMVAYEAYLKSTNGAATTLYRLYPRDFWMVE